MKQAVLCAAAAIAAILLAGSVRAVEATDAPAEPAIGRVEDGRGQVTNLPVPRFVSLKTSEGNVRRGPSLTHRIDWVFTRRDMPLQIVAEHGNWRRVVDRDGMGGWIHYALLSGVRTVMVETDMVELRSRPDERASVRAQAELGVIARLGACSRDWCEITAGGESGWVQKAAIWGVDAGELRD